MSGSSGGGGGGKMATTRIKYITEEFEQLRGRAHWKCGNMRITLTKFVLAISIMLLLIFASIVYRGVALTASDHSERRTDTAARAQFLHDRVASADAVATAAWHANNVIGDRDGDGAAGRSANSVHRSYAEEQRIRLKHLRFKYRTQFESRNRVARELNGHLDPVHVAKQIDFADLYARVRSKRARIAFNKLEQEYTRCKKHASTDNECMQAFAQMYRVASDIGEMLERMKQIFKDSERILQQSASMSSHESTDAAGTEPVAMSSTKTPAPAPTPTPSIADIKQDDKQKSEKIPWILDGHDDDVANESDESASNATSSTTIAAIVSTTVRGTTTVTTLRIRDDNLVGPAASTARTATTASSVVTTADTKSDKFPWILDGNESDERQQQESTTTTTASAAAAAAAITVAETTATGSGSSAHTTTAAPRTALNASSTAKSDEIIQILDEDDGDEDDNDSVEMVAYSTTSKPTANPTPLVSSSYTAAATTTPQAVALSTEAKNRRIDVVPVATTTVTATASAIDIDANTTTAKLARTQYSWMMDAAANAHTPIGDDVADSMETSTELASSTSAQLQTLSVVVTIANVTIGYGGSNCGGGGGGGGGGGEAIASPSADCNDALPVQSTTLPAGGSAGAGADAPSSLENMLGSFERDEQSKPLLVERVEATSAHPAAAQSIDRDAKQLNDELSGDARAPADDEQEALIDLFTDITARNISKFGPKLNPANKSGLGAADVNLLTLCERMAKRMRGQSMSQSFADDEAGGSADSGMMKPTQPTAPQFVRPTGRAPVGGGGVGGGGFPVTGETIKASAQFMMNPNFMMQTIPICFHVTPSSFRIVSQPFMMPSFYGGGGGGGGGGGAGGGGGGAAGQSGMMGGGHGGIFVMPQGAGGGGGGGGMGAPTGGILFSAGTATGGQTNIFTKNATPFKQQQQQQQQQQRQRQKLAQQVYCTYMQQPGANVGVGGGVPQPGMGAGVGIVSAPGIGGIGFTNANFKLRTAGQRNATHANANASGDIIYASYAAVPALGADDDDTDGQFQCTLPGQMACAGNNECVRETAWCDGRVDCADGSDEATCTCRHRLTTRRLCDGYPDCPMGEDEIGCFGCGAFMYSCYADAGAFERQNRSVVAMCYSALERCDGIQNCLNGRDERDCNLIVADVAHHVGHAVSAPAGYLYHNFRGEWYPVCNNAEQWARDACDAEGLWSLAAPPNVSFHAATLQGPFIEPSLRGVAHFPQSCQQRNGPGDALVDYATWVECAPAQCGRVVSAPQRANVLKSKRHRQRRSRSHSRQQRNAPNAGEEEEQEQRIVGGGYSQPQQWPFVVAVYRNGNFHCGGSIYAEQWVISAAHCVINYVKYHYEVHAGMLRRSSYAAHTQIRVVSHVIVHGAYERRTMRNDVALLRLAQPLRFNRWVRPVCLPAPGRSTDGADWVWGPEAGTPCTVVGWGAVREKGQGSDQLREVTVPIRKRCAERVDQEAEGVCAGDAGGGRDACQGDSGGPLFCRSVARPAEWYLAGVVSHGNGCARVGEFGVYTRVALFLDWLEMALQPKLLPRAQPLQMCPGHVCIWGGQRCIAARRRCDRIVDCLGGEDEVGCIYNFVPDVGSALNVTATTESDYYPELDGDDDDDKSNVARVASTELSTIAEVEVEADADAFTTDAFIAELNATLSAVTATTSDVHFDRLVTMSDDVDVDADDDATSTATMDASTTPTTTSPTTIPMATDLVTDAPSTVLPTATEAQRQLHELVTQVLEGGLNGGITNTTAPSPLTFDSGNGSGSGATTPSTSPITKRATTNEISPITDAPPATIDVMMTTTTTAAPTIITVTTVKPAEEQRKMPDKFICHRIPQIIDRSHRCDRIVDCEDGTDEENCNCRDYLKGPLSILVCDGKTDCEDLTDEDDCGKCGGDEFLCPLSKTCVPLRKRCDDAIDCRFHEDEQNCYALTNGKEVLLDANKQPTLSPSGVFSRNAHGTWRVVCTHETEYHQHSAKTAGDVCALFGFHGFRYYNTTEYLPPSAHQHTPIDPELRAQQTPPHGLVRDSMATADAMHVRPSMPMSKSRERSIRIDHVLTMSEPKCLGLYLECNPRLNRTKPLRTLSAGAVHRPPQLHATPSALVPTLQTYAKPNVYAAPAPTPAASPLPVTLLQPQEDMLERMQRLIGERRNHTLLVHDQLHEAVEELHWPWLVDVYVNGRLWCVGVLVDRHWVVVHSSCLFAIRLNSDYVAALLGGGKTQHAPHRSPNEQIRRVDCFEMVPNSDVLLYRLERPVHYTHHVMPIFLPQLNGAPLNESAIEQCISLLHDNQLGRVRSVAVARHRGDRLCSSSDLPCYRLVERRPPAAFGGEHASSASWEEGVMPAAAAAGDALLAQSLSPLTLCTQFGTTLLNSSREPIDQGVIVCRNADSGWYPMALYDYNNTNCNSFHEPFSMRTLQHAYDAIEHAIESPKCGVQHEAPACATHRCPLGECVDAKALCDGRNDCHDGSDEQPLACLRKRTPCSVAELMCRSTQRCIPKTKFCDHEPDCDDLTDEPAVCSCFTYLQATEPHKICDGVRNCWDKSDESPALCNCTAEHFVCGTASAECIPRDFVCDSEPDCPNGEDEKYCYGIEEPLRNHTATHTPTNWPTTAHASKRPPEYGQVIEQSYGVWHTKCFSRKAPPTDVEVRRICRQLGYSPYTPPSYRLIDDAAGEVVRTNEQPDMRGRSFSDAPLAGKYRDATKAVIASKFSPLHLNDELTLFIKPSRPIAELARWNATDSNNCYRMEIRCA